MRGWSHANQYLPFRANNVLVKCVYAIERRQLLKIQPTRQKRDGEISPGLDNRFRLTSSPFKLQ